MKNSTLLHVPNQYPFVNGNLSNNDYTIIDSDIKVRVEEDTVIGIGGDFNITGRELKACLKFLLEQATQAYPEEFI